jgi:hypothetical protein
MKEEGKTTTAVLSPAFAAGTSLTRTSHLSDSILILYLQTPEEIEQWCTKDDLDDVKRAVFMLKKGYEIQKISVST